jgi:hypothetical protein
MRKEFPSSSCGTASFASLGSYCTVLTVPHVYRTVCTTLTKAVQIPVCVMNLGCMMMLDLHDEIDVRMRVARETLLKSQSVSDV